jgi:hypothetical protein
VANGSSIATEAIQLIGALYDIERDIRGKTATLRQEIRQARARPLVDELHRWFNKTLAGHSRKSDTAGAIRYALSRWRALTRYLDDGRIEIGRVEMWRGSLGLASGFRPFRLPVPQCPDRAPFPHPAHQTERADLPHPAYARLIKSSHSTGRGD